MNKINYLEKSLIIFGLFWGILGYGIYLLGLLGLFNRPIIFAYFGILVVGLIYFSFRNKLISKKLEYFKKIYHDLVSDKVLIVILLLALIMMVLNFILLLAPEVEFDALWYHLTLPKIYLQAGSVQYLKGGLLYYSVMPRLVEMLYGFGLAINSSGILAKLIHYLFGLAWFFGSYIFAREYLNRKSALLSAVTVYSLYLVTWLSATAYIDLTVSFFVIMSLWALIRYFKNSNENMLYLSAIFMGLNLASKTYGLMIFAAILIILLFKKGFKKTLIFGAISFLIVLPFYLQAYLSTGNPIYPVFSVPDKGLPMYLDGRASLGSWLKEVWLFKLPALFWNVIIYQYTSLFGLVLAIFFVPNWKKVLVPISIFFGFFLLWSLVPMHEPRYFIIILPVLSTLVFFIFENVGSIILKTIVIILFILGIGSGLSQTRQYFSETFKVVFGRITKTDYLSEKLYRPQTFYDFSGNFKREVSEKKVLTVGIHNLFYLPFSFSDWTFIEDQFDRNNPDNFLKLLAQNKIDYILAGDMSMSTLTGFRSDFLENHFSLLLEEDHFRLYKINY